MRSSVIPAAIGVLFVAACGTDEPTGPDQDSPASVAAVTATTSGTPGWRLDAPVRVIVRNGAGQPMPGIAVTWSSDANDAWLSATTSTTDAAGAAEVAFAPGAAPGTQRVIGTVGPLRGETQVIVSGLALQVVATANRPQGAPMACGLDQEGALFCWTQRLEASVAANPVRETLPPEARPVRAPGDRRYRLLVGSGAGAAFAGGRFCAVDTQGGLWCWVPPATITNAVTPEAVATPAPFRAVAIAAGRDQSPAELATCGLDDAGVVWCRGTNADGEVGTGTTTAVTAFTAVGGVTRFATIRSGAAAFCATDLADRAWCWGNNRNGNLLREGPLALTVPTLVAGDLALTVAAPLLSGGCGVTRDAAATVHCWGDARVTYVGGSVPTAGISAPIAQATGVTQFVGGGYGFALLRRQDGALSVAGDFIEDPPINALRPTPVAHPRQATGVAPLLTTVGEVWCVADPIARCAWKLNALAGIPSPAP